MTNSTRKPPAPVKIRRVYGYRPMRAVDQDPQTARPVKIFHGPPNLARGNLYKYRLERRRRVEPELPPAANPSRHRSHTPTSGEKSTPTRIVINGARRRKLRPRRRPCWWRRRRSRRRPARTRRRRGPAHPEHRRQEARVPALDELGTDPPSKSGPVRRRRAYRAGAREVREIGRASCRERV